MDQALLNYKALPFEDDLMIIDDMGIAFQKDMTHPVKYDNDYFLKYIKYEGTDVANAINHGRLDLTLKYAQKDILDVGIGSGEFIKRGYERALRKKFYGYDVNPTAVVWLKNKFIWVDPFTSVPQNIDTVTLWDSFEHMQDPGSFLNRFRVGTYLLLSIPIYGNLWEVKKSKHYRPNEHFYYHTPEGIKRHMMMHHFNFLEERNFEITAGRDSIMSYAFQKIG